MSFLENVFNVLFLLQGAAVSDGRLRAGDRMVSVNGVAVSGLSQQQVVSLLRSTPTNSTVTIVVERPQTAIVQTVSAVHNKTQVGVCICYHSVYLLTLVHMYNVRLHYGLTITLICIQLICALKRIY